MPGPIKPVIIKCGRLWKWSLLDYDSAVESGMASTWREAYTRAKAVKKTYVIRLCKRVCLQNNP